MPSVPVSSSKRKGSRTRAKRNNDSNELATSNRKKKLETTSALTHSSQFYEAEKVNKKKKRQKSSSEEHKNKIDAVCQPSPSCCSVASQIIPVSSVPRLKYFQNRFSQVCTALFVPDVVKFNFMKRQPNWNRFAVKNRGDEVMVGCVSEDGKKTLTPECSSVKSWFKKLKLDFACYSFDNKVTAVEWHPGDRRILAVGTKNGSVMVWNTSKKYSEGDMYLGNGPGNYIGSLKFDPGNRNLLYSASMDGTVLKRDIVTRTCSAISTLTVPVADSYRRWWVATDVSSTHGILLAGDNKGIASAVTPGTGEMLWTLKLHKSKIHHLEFSKREPWLFATASTEHVVKLWDIRAVTDSSAWPKPLFQLTHNRVVNIATFSPTGSNRLLTSDQGEECRVYQGPSWHLLTKFEHPHRQFQHLIHIRAAWHPLVDAVVIGRYPKVTNEAKTIDIFDGVTGGSIVQLWQCGGANANIVSLSKFNSTGDCLAVTATRTLMLWRPGTIKREGDIVYPCRRVIGENDDSDSDSRMSKVEIRPFVPRKRYRKPKKVEVPKKIGGVMRVRQCSGSDDYTESDS